jgi:nucleotide-binding universal stress UspA family protein
MPSLAKILLPIDFSDRSHRAARYVARLSTHFGSEITVLHVLPPPPYEFAALELGGAAMNELYSARSRQVRAALDTALSADLGNATVKRLLLEGDPAREIVACAHSGHFDVILMPTHGYGPFRRFILGSVTAKVLHDADCPVWTGLHLPEAAPMGADCFRNVLVAVSLSPHSAQQLKWAVWLAASWDARLWLVHVAQAGDGNSKGHASSKSRQDAIEQAKAEIARLIEPTGASLDVLVEGGDVPSAVCDAASRVAAGVLVIGRGSAAGIFGRLQANAYSIIRQSPCPVLSV